MRRIPLGFTRLWITLLAWCCMGGAVLYAQAGRNQKEVDDLVRSAQQSEMLGYLLAGAGFLVIVIGIALTIYLDRKKKAKKQANRQNQ